MVPGVFERRTCPVGKPTGTCSTLGLSLTLEDSTRNSVCLPSRTATVRPFRTAPPPLRFPAPTALQDLRSLLPGLSIPNAAPKPNRSCFPSATSFQTSLVASIQARFVPPSPFSTTLAVFSSQAPVVCFDHSHPWGCCPATVAPSRSENLCATGWARNVGLPADHLLRNALHPRRRSFAG